MSAAAIAEIRGALSGLSGQLPRRAVVVHDAGSSVVSVIDKVQSPLSTEATSLSVVCDILRREQGEPVYSRHTPHLLAQCLGTNDAGAWRALLDDAATSDLDVTEAAAFFGGDGARLEALVRCLVVAETGMHAWLVIRAMECVLPLLGTDGARRLGGVFQAQFAEIVRGISRRVRDISVDMRGGAITTLGKLMLWCNIPPAHLCDMLLSVLKSPDDDVLRLFLFAPVATLAEQQPALVEKLLGRAERAPHASKYPATALLATMAPDQLRPHADRISKLVQKTLDTALAKGNMEPRLAMVCGALIKVTKPRTLHASLAHALCCMSLSNEHP